jgi:arylsulfatase A-like enzyme
MERLGVQREWWRRSSVAASMSMLFAWPAVGEEAPAPQPAAPNILLILADDLGYCDVGAYAARLHGTTPDRIFYETPRLDALAAQGMMFTQFYACAVCTPSRASLLTGKMSNRLGMWDAYAAVSTSFNRTGRPVPEGGYPFDHVPWDEYRYSRTDRGVSVPLAGTALRRGVRTFPEGLEGYHTAMIGKWHLGSHNSEGYRPADRGFDEVLSYFDGGGSGYYRPFRAYAARTPQWDDPGPALDPPEDYLSDDIAARVNRFLEERATHHPETPFFLYVSHPAVHTPIESRADDRAYFTQRRQVSGLIGHDEPEYAGLVRGLDRSVGAMLDKLDALDLADRTVVIFLSDNGGHPGMTRHAPLRGGKSMLYEGGIRVPMMVRWPGRIEAGALCDVPADITDIYPTVMEIAKVAYDDFKADPATDGLSLLPLFEDPENTGGAYGRTAIYHFYGKEGYKGYHQFATWATLRQGDYKLHYDYNGQVELYHIAQDIGETRDLVASQPRRAHDMLVQLTGWLAANCPPLYLPKPNPDYDPDGPQPYGPYRPLEELKAQLLSAAEAGHRPGH